MDPGPDLESLRLRFVGEQPRYERLRHLAETVLGEALAREALFCEVKGRVKDVASFVKKAIRKAYDDPWEGIHDKVGIRAVTAYEGDIEAIERVVRASFDVHHQEDKRKTLDPTRLDYLGVHLEVSLKDANICSIDEDLRGVLCEIQIHTRAQNLWATVSHELIYKTAQEVPPETKRAIHRLLALIELFDQEVQTGRGTIMALPGFREGRLFNDLERHFYQLTARRADRELSLLVIRSLLGLFNESELDRYADMLTDFVEAHRAKLRQIYDEYLNDARHPLMSQPESLLIFEQLERDPYTLLDVWSQELPDKLLKALAEIWGAPLDL